MKYERYKLIEGSESFHCCFEWTVVDTGEQDETDGQDKTVCETFNREDAELVANAINASQGDAKCH